MESENIDLKEQGGSPLSKVTPLSKYLAMLLFIVMPFIGGWIGYTYAPAKTVEIEKVIVKEVGLEKLLGTEKASFGKINDVSTLTTITTLPVDPASLGGDYANKKDYIFDNGVYTVSFTFPRGLTMFDDYVDAEKSWTDLYQVHFTKHTEENGKSIFLSYYAHNKGYCRLSLCEKTYSSTVDIIGNQWEFLGGYEYCDAGECGGSDYTYRKSTGDFVEYITTDIPISELLKDETASNLLSTLKFSIN